MDDLIVNHFHSLLMESTNDRINTIQRITQNIPHQVSRDQNLGLMRVVSMEEVEEVVKGMAKNKADGPHGFTTKLFQVA